MDPPLTASMDVTGTSDSDGEELANEDQEPLLTDHTPSVPVCSGGGGDGDGDGDSPHQQVRLQQWLP